MTPRSYYDPEAGRWVACREWTNDKGQVQRAYPWAGGSPQQWGGNSWTSSPRDAIRYDTRAEALAAIAGPRIRGVRRIAHRIESGPKA